MPIGRRTPIRAGSLFLGLTHHFFHDRRYPMTVKTMEDLFVETLKDIYYV